MDISKLEEYIEQYSKNGNDSIEYIGRITTALKNHDIQLVTVVEKLGWLLSSEDKSLRSKGLSFLVHVLQDSGQELFSEKEVESLVTFFCSRLSDHHDFLPITLEGLLILSSLPNLNENDVHTIGRSIFSEVHTAAQLQEDRRKVYSIICNLLDGHITDLQKMESEFLLSYIQTMDGERDPRCLLMAFRIVTILAKTFELGENVEDLFEVVACYFPVDFRAPAKDAFGISQDDLAESLEECLTSTALFAPFFMPLMLEKFTSELDSAKLHALSALQRFASLYGSLGLRNELKNIWSAIRREVFSGKDEAVSQTCLKCLSTVVSSLTEEECSTFTGSIWKECSQVIQGDSELSLVSANILRAIFSGVTTTHRKALFKTAIPYVTQVIKETEGSQRLSHLHAFTVILDVPPLGPFRTWDCPPECWSLLMSLVYPEDSDQGKGYNINSCSWLAVEKLLRLGSHVPEPYMLSLVQSIQTHATREHSACATKKALIATCTALVQAYPDAPQVQTLMQSLFSHAGGLVDDIFVAVCASSPVTAEMWIIDPLITGFLSNNAHEETLCKCLKSLASVRKETREQKHMTESYLGSLVARALFDIYQGKDGIQDRPLYYAIEAMVSALDPISAMQLAQKLLSVVISNESSAESILTVTPIPYESLPKGSQSAISQVLRSVLPHLAPTAEPCTFQDPVRWLVSKSLMDDDINMAQTLAGLANKCPCCGQLAFDLIKEREVNKNVIRTMIWLTKALLLSNHPRTKEITEMVLGHLASPLYGSTVAKEFEVILKPAKDVLKSSSHAQVALFHAQRFFSLTASFLLASYHNAIKEHRCNYLTALCCQLKYLPMPVLKQELPPLLPVLVAILDPDQENQDVNLLLSSLDGLCLLLGSENLNLASTHLSTLIPGLVKLSRDQRSMKIRIGALKCLYELPSLPTEKVLLYSSEVLRSFKNCLDDKKRLVRKEAAKTACKWHLVGQETND